MDNPFKYGEPVKGESFGDRKDEIQELVSDLSRGQNVIIFSPRRFGKTSLILEVLEQLKSKGLITIYVDLFRVTSKEKFITTLAEAISKSFTGKIERVLTEVRKILPRLIPKIVIKGENVPEIEFTYRRGDDEGPVIDDLLEATHNVTQKAKKRAAIVLDEFQEIAHWDDGEVEREMRAHFQMHDTISYVFMGSKRHLMMDIFRNKNRPFYRFGKHFPLERIPGKAFAEFILDKFRKGGFRVAKEAIDEIITKTGSHPYYTQVLCSTLWDKCVNEKTIEVRDVSAGIKEVIKREAHAYNDVWNMITLRAKQLLEALAIDPTSKVYSKDFLHKHNFNSPSTIQRAVKFLEREEIIERENDTYMFTDIFFRLWIIHSITHSE